MGVSENIEMGIASGERTVNVQLWKSYADEFSIFLVHSDGQVLGPLQKILLGYGALCVSESITR